MFTLFLILIVLYFITGLTKNIIYIINYFNKKDDQKIKQKLIERKQ